MSSAATPSYLEIIDSIRRRQLGNMLWRMRLVPLSLPLLLALNLCQAQSPSCDSFAAIPKMAESKSKQSLVNWKNKAGDSYISRLVFAFRLFELEPKERLTASMLLSMIPPTKDEETLWYTLDGLLCEEESMKDVEKVAELHARMPHDLARAVLLVPERLREYVSYAKESVQDPHSDYAFQMRSVCRTKHQAFLGAVDSLTTADRQWFVRKIFDPNECRAIAVPEAE